MSVLIFLVILAVLIFVHELGHFLAAKSFGIRVDSFAIGFPPTLWKRTYGETTYKLNLIPFGGYVKIFGESPDDEILGPMDQKKSLMYKPKYQQALVLLAGIFFNLVFAWILLSVSNVIGITSIVRDVTPGTNVVNEQMMILGVSPESPAEQAGILVGDVIVPQSTNLDYTDATSFRLYAGQKTESIDLSVKRGDEMLVVAVTPEYSSETGTNLMGVYVEDVGIVKRNVPQALWHGLKDTGSMTRDVAVAFGGLIKDAFTGKGDISTLTGPVGLVGVVGDAQKLGLVFVLTLTALISVNLAVLNLIPFPALDGGRVFFLFIEKITGSHIKPIVFNVANAIGFVLLMALMIIVTAHDIIGLF